MGNRMGLIGWLVIVVAILLLRGASVTTAATVYTVGGSLGWTVPPNTSYYSTWATTNLQTFKLGDQLEFKSTNSTKTHAMREVSKADYDNCTKQTSTFEVNTVLTFTPPNGGPYYIICTVDDDCERGQKFSFNVIGPAQSPTSSASSLSVAAFLFALLSTTLIYFFA